MNDDMWEGKWKQVRGHMKEWWGKITDDDADRLKGSFEALVGLLQEKYGYTRQKAMDEIDRRLKELDREPMHR